jgi:hypothetical protein
MSCHPKPLVIDSKLRDGGEGPALVETEEVPRPEELAVSNAYPNSMRRRLRAIRRGSQPREIGGKRDEGWNRRLQTGWAWTPQFGQPGARQNLVDHWYSLLRRDDRIRKTLRLEFRACEEGGENEKSGSLHRRDLLLV